MAPFKVNTPSLSLVQELPAGGWAQDPGGLYSFRHWVQWNRSGGGSIPPSLQESSWKKSVSNMWP